MRNLFLVLIGVVAITVCTACTKIQDEETAHPAKVVQSARTANDGWNGLQCWAVVELLEDEKRLTVRSPTDKCLTLISEGQSVTMKHFVRRNYEDVVIDSWDLE